MSQEKCQTEPLEIWKTIPNGEQYEASNKGRIRSKTRYIWNGKGFYLKPGQLIKQSISKRGYCVITKISGLPSQQVHRLIAMAFIPNEDSNKNQINHINGVKTDNRVENLEWCDNSYNQLHAYQMGLNKRCPEAGRKPMPVIKLDATTRSYIEEYKSLAEATRKNNINGNSNIRAVCLGKRKTAGGFAWKFKEKKGW